VALAVGWSITPAHAEELPVSRLPLARLLLEQSGAQFEELPAAPRVAYARSTLRLLLSGGDDVTLTAMREVTYLVTAIVFLEELGSRAPLGREAREALGRLYVVTWQVGTIVSDNPALVADARSQLARLREPGERLMQERLIETLAKLREFGRERMQRWLAPLLEAGRLSPELVTLYAAHLSIDGAHDRAIALLPKGGPLRIAHARVLQRAGKLGEAEAIVRAIVTTGGTRAAFARKLLKDLEASRAALEGEAQGGLEGLTRALVERDGLADRTAAARVAGELEKLLRADRGAKGKHGDAALHAIEALGEHAVIAEDARLAAFVESEVKQRKLASRRIVEVSLAAPWRKLSSGRALPPEERAALRKTLDTSVAALAGHDAALAKDVRLVIDAAMLPQDDGTPEAAKAATGAAEALAKRVAGDSSASHNAHLIVALLRLGAGRDREATALLDAAVTRVSPDARNAVRLFATRIRLVTAIRTGDLPSARHALATLDALVPAAGARPCPPDGCVDAPSLDLARATARAFLAEGTPEAAPLLEKVLSTFDAAERRGRLVAQSAALLSAAIAGRAGQRARFLADLEEVRTLDPSSAAGDLAAAFASFFSGELDAAYLLARRVIDRRSHLELGFLSNRLAFHVADALGGASLAHADALERAWDGASKRFHDRDANAWFAAGDSFVGLHYRCGRGLVVDVWAEPLAYVFPAMGQVSRARVRDALGLSTPERGERKR